MRYSSIKEIAEIVDAFQHGEIPRADWTHGAYLTVALSYCVHFSTETAASRMREGILRLNERNGVANTKTSGYHETMTVFWITTIKEFLRTTKQGNIVSLANDLIAAYGDPRLPLKYYSRKVLFSPEARGSYVPPDLGRFLRFINSAKLAARVGGYADAEYA